MSVSWLSSMSHVSVLFATVLTLKQEDEHGRMVALFSTGQLTGQQQSTHRWAHISICFPGVGVKLCRLSPGLNGKAKKQMTFGWWQHLV